MTLLHTESVIRQFSVQEIPLPPLRIAHRQPAVVQRQTSGILRQRQLRPPHQHQRIALQLFAADTRKCREELRQQPLRLRPAAVLQAAARRLVDQAITVLPGKPAPRLLLPGIKVALHLPEVRQRAQLRLPPGRDAGIVLFTG